MSDERSVTGALERRLISFLLLMVIQTRMHLEILFVVGRKMFCQMQELIYLFSQPIRLEVLPLVQPLLLTCILTPSFELVAGLLPALSLDFIIYPFSLLPIYKTLYSSVFRTKIELNIYYVFETGCVTV